MKVLVVVDMQNDFITGTLGTKEAVAIVPGVVKKIEQHQKDGSVVAFTMDTHRQNYLDTLEGKNLPVKHCIRGRDGWNFNNDVARTFTQEYSDKKALVIFKDTFGGKDLVTEIEKILNNNDDYEIVDEIELVGLCGNICVIANAILLKSYFPEIPITVDASCIASTTPEANVRTIQQMKDLQINIIGE